MKKSIIKNLALLLGILFLFTGCNISDFIGGFLSERRTVAFEKMEYARPDGDAILSGMDELVEKAKNATSYDELVSADNKVSKLLSPLITAYSLSELKTYLDVTDEYFEQEFSYCSDLYVEVSSKITSFNRAIIDGPFANDYKAEIGDYLYQNMQNDLLMESEEVAPLKKERNQLDMDYNKALNNMSFQHNGETLTFDDISKMVDSNESYYRLMREYYKQNADLFTEFYLKILQLDKEIAYKLGFTSAAEYYYLSYSRDYTPADAMEYAKNSKEIFAPLYAEIEQPRAVAMSQKQAFYTMPSVLNSIDPSLSEAWKFMEKYNLSDFDARDNKQEGIAFQTNISAYDAPFIYGYWDDSTDSLSTLSHEFGHFYDSWLEFSRDRGTVFNLDIAESYSQSLELLVSFKFDEFTSNADAARQKQLYDFLNPLVWQIALEEFQQKAFELDTFDADIIATLYADTMAEYGLGGVYVDENGRDYSWFRVTHLFDSPFYTVSYWTSASVALQIWSAANEDYQSGVNLYLGMINSDQNRPFTEVVSGAGLQDPSDLATMKKIAIDLLEAFDLDVSDYPALAA